MKKFINESLEEQALVFRNVSDKKDFNIKIFKLEY